MKRTMISLRIGEKGLDAITRAATECGVSRNSWMILAIGHALKKGLGRAMHAKHSRAMQFLAPERMLQIRIAPDMAKLVDEDAEKCGMTRTRWIAMACLQKA